MTTELFIASVAVLIQLGGVFFYIRDMIKGSAKPNRISWSIWALAPFIGVWLAWQAGGGLALLPVFMAGFNPVLVLLASFIIRKGVWEIKMFDVYCGVLALFALVLWVLTHNFSISILFAILADGLAAFPTILKSWKYPDTESASAYIGGIFANILGLIIIKEWSFPIYSLGVYFILINLMIVFSIYRKKFLCQKKQIIHF